MFVLEGGGAFNAFGIQDVVNHFSSHWFEIERLPKYQHFSFTSSDQKSSHKIINTTQILPSFIVADIIGACEPDFAKTLMEKLPAFAKSKGMSSDYVEAQQPPPIIMTWMYNGGTAEAQRKRASSNTISMRHLVFRTRAENNDTA